MRIMSDVQWPAAFDIEGLIADGWEPVPFREFVLKIHSRCDLSCDYCYMYTMADQSWRSRPRRMSLAVVEQSAARIAEHVRAHQLRSIKLSLHGGEPLLAGRDLISHAVTSVREAIGSDASVDVTIQTNGIRLNAAYLELFKNLCVRVGVSLDGYAAAHDRHRTRADGRGSHAEVATAIRRLAAKPYRELFGGLLCTVNVRNDPIATYEAMLEFDPPLIDFLLPHGNWTSPPPGRVSGSSETPYADWLIPVFDRWYGASRRETQVRLFSETMHALLGGESHVEAIGLAPVAMIVIETDGSIEQSDNLKSAYPGACSTGLHVARDTFDMALLRPATIATQIGVNALSTKCRTCKWMRVCGGGSYAHRYQSGSGFAHPSVYCPDLFKFIEHVRRTMQADIERLLISRGPGTAVACESIR
jgi:uncharacterized protein